jgi:hypothetical protein
VGRLASSERRIAPRPPYSVFPASIGTSQSRLGVRANRAAVRPAASRAHLPIGERVKIVWMDDEPVDVPHRGERFDPRAFTW